MGPPRPPAPTPRRTPASASSGHRPPAPPTRPSTGSLSEWRMQNIARDSENSSEDEFFDAHEGFSDSDEVFPKEMTKWNSNDFIDAFASPSEAEGAPEPGTEATKGLEDGTRASRDSEGPDGARELGAEACAVHALFLILHSGNILDSGPGDASSKQADVQTLSSAFEAVTRVHFPEALGHVALRLVPCPPICATAYALVSNLSPYSHDGDSLSRSQDHIPLAALPLLATSSSRYQGAVATVIARTNQAYAAFLRSAEGAGFCGQVVLIGDGVGGILGFDALCHSAGTGSRGSSRRGSMNNELLSPELGPVRDPLADGVEGLGRASPEPSTLPAQRMPSGMARPEPEGAQNSLQAAPAAASGEPRRASTASCPPAAGPEAPDGPTGAARLDFKVSGFFLFGSPLGLVLALRKTVMPALEVAQMRPACEQIYNLFHAADPCASRLEPLLAPKFQAIAPLAVPRYQKFPLGDGSSLLLADTLQAHSGLFLEELDALVPSTPTSAGGGFWKGSELGTEPPAQPAAPSTTTEVVKILERWWGTKRIDYSLYCPEALTAFPTVTLPHLFHASYWESADVVAFILRQVIEKERPQLAECEEPSVYSPAFPREKWQRKRTQVKIRNVTSNHRASDTVVCEGRPQVLSGRFMYGPLDVVTLTGEKVDVYIMTQPLSGKWIHFGTEVTNSSGRLTFSVAPGRALGIGVYPVRMVVRGDHTYAECCLTVVARGTEAVVFSIDGSFTASVSIMGSDPKALAGRRLPDPVRDGPAGHAEAPRGGLAVPAQLPPRRRLLLRRPQPRPAAPKGHVPAEPGAGGGTEYRGRLWVSQRRGCVRGAGPVPEPDLHRGTCGAEAAGAVSVPVGRLRGPPGPAGGGRPLPRGPRTTAGSLGQEQLRRGCARGLPPEAEPAAALQGPQPGGARGPGDAAHRPGPWQSPEHQPQAGQRRRVNRTPPSPKHTRGHRPRGCGGRGGAAPHTPAPVSAPRCYFPFVGDLAPGERGGSGRGPCGFSGVCRPTK
ncbi:membrane-associated phosphatidylinositol transfer protein 1 isoform X3 [Lepus europaeus]|uniref:membrane-associated phosphatidylinositol transfer protein 1 isoform X3 n=1 Tax=Lepus europaeus TaxID=9983 RepID=UPI002B491B5D|nr:membrane-associated phosphatidylinositol transfer protein 1 isoform X3 [Lepus europaeus]